MTITYTLSVTISRPVETQDDSTLESVAEWMQSSKAKVELEREVIKALRKIDRNVDAEVMDTQTVPDANGR